LVGAEPLGALLHDLARRRVDRLGTGETERTTDRAERDDDTDGGGEKCKAKPDQAAG
jgi:hypothetical protein